MRFRYIDADGAEIEVASVDALKLRIGIGDVTPRTRLYDAAVGEWAPAGEHKVFRFLVEEEEGLLPESSRAMLDGGEGAGAAGEGGDDRVAAARGDGSGEPVAGRSDAATPGAATSDAATPDLPDEVRSIGPGGGGPGYTAWSGRRRGHRSFAAAGEGRHLAWTVGVVLLLATSSALFFHLREAGTAVAPGGSLAEGRSAGPEEIEVPSSGASREVGPGTGGESGGPSSVPGAGVGSPDEDGSGGASRGEGGSGGEPSGPEAAVAADGGGDDWPASLAPEVQAAASGDLARAMVELQQALGVPDGPPPSWLEGRYLAGAGRYDDVREFWRAYGSFVSSMEALEEELFRGFVQNRVLKMGLDTADAAGLSARVLERYEAAAGKRRVVYRDLRALSEEAVALHDTLVARSADIAYEPFRGRGLSRDPVVEAVADEPRLAEHLWTRLDRIFELLERLQGVQPVTTLRLQEALLGSLRVPEPDG